jgi:hypothetical protein
MEGRSVKLTIRPLRIDRRRAARALRDGATWLAAAAPLLLGILIAVLVTIVQALWLAVLWLLAAGIAGYEIVRPRR